MAWAVWDTVVVMSSASVVFASPSPSSRRRRAARRRRRSLRARVEFGATSRLAWALRRRRLAEPPSSKSDAESTELSAAAVDVDAAPSRPAATALDTVVPSRPTASIWTSGARRPGFATSVAIVPSTWAVASGDAAASTPSKADSVAAMSVDTRSVFASSSPPAAMTEEMDEISRSADSESPASSAAPTASSASAARDRRRRRRVCVSRAGT
mmetsp:Transcript_13426/g.46025  ORF Transcript_13426/g.46025 Transcript_13426/m.46025 type:complete len:212 (+) Transcript_13426:179-814(+)